jgi:uncharacterized membrane protein AbrB (regulator of aidB expression)
MEDSLGAAEELFSDGEAAVLVSLPQAATPSSANEQAAAANTLRVVSVVMVVPFWVEFL